MNNFRLTALLTIFITISTGTASAQQRTEEDELRQLYGDSELISLVTGKRQRIQDAPAVAGVLTAQQIKVAGATTLDQVTDYGMLDSRLELGSDRWQLRLWSRHLVDSGYGPGLSQALNDNTRLDSDTYTVDFSYHARPAREWEVDLHTSYPHHDGDYFLEALPSGTMVPIGDDGNIFTPGGGMVTFPDGVRIKLNAVERHYALDATAVYSGMNRHRWRLAAGASYKEFDSREAGNDGQGVLDGANFMSVVDGTLTDLTGTPSVWAPNESRTQQFFSLQDEWTFAQDWSATIGGRHDQYSDFGGTFNPRLALVWQTRYDLTTKLLYGRAFRPPALVELYTKNNPVQLGNPDLLPESIDTHELVFDYRPPTPAGSGPRT